MTLHHVLCYLCIPLLIWNLRKVLVASLQVALMTIVVHALPELLLDFLFMLLLLLLVHFVVVIVILLTVVLPTALQAAGSRTSPSQPLR